MLTGSTLFLTELRRTLKLWWAYRFDAIAWIAMWSVGFPLFMMIFDNVAGVYGPQEQQASLIGFLVWNLSMSVLSETTRDTAREISEGTLENVALNPTPLIVVFALRMVAFFARHAVQTTVLGTVLVLVLGLSVPLAGPVLILTILVALGVGGLGLAFDGLAMVYRQIDTLVRLGSLLLVVVSGALVPLNNIGIAFAVLKYVVPTTWGIDALREAMLHGATSATLWVDGTLLGLAIQAVVFIAIGAVVFNWGYRQARIQGGLGTY